MKSPFKFLDSYTKDDREIFFGRDREIEELYQRVFESKLLLVYGVSGTGKSSLIHCGLANKFQETDWLPLVVRRGGNIIDSMAAAIRSASLTAQQNKFANPSDFKKGVRSLYLDHYKPVFFIFDQFEELFIFGDKEERKSFISIVKNLTESELQCRMIFVMREEYMAGITEFEKYIPTIFSNRVRIEKMSHRNALEVIINPCKAFNITLEEGFAEALLEKLSPGETDVELTYLQVFLDKIFRLAVGFIPPLQGGQGGSDQPKGGSVSRGGASSGQGNVSFTLSLLEKTGNVSDLLGSFLDDQVALMDDPDSAMTVLKAFVSGKGTKRPASEQEANDYIRSFGKDLSVETLKELIQTFVKLRVLRDKDDNGRYELRHDALAEKVYEKFSTTEKELLEIRQFIENSYQSYLKRNVLLNTDDLDFISGKDSQLNLNPDLQLYLEESRKYRKAQTRLVKRLIIISAVAFIMLLATIGYTIIKNSSSSNSIKLAKTSINQMLRPVDQLCMAGGAWSLSRTEEAKEALLKAFNNIIRNPGDNEEFIKLRNEYYIEFKPVLSPILFSDCTNDNRFIYGYTADSIYIWTTTGYLHTSFSSGNTIISMLMSDDGEYLGAVSKDSILTVWDISGRKLFARKIGYNPVNIYQVFRFSKDNRIITISELNDADLIDLNGNIIQSFKLHKGSVNAVDISEDGKMIITASSDGTMNIWSVNAESKNFELYNQITTHSDTVWSADLSKNKKYLISASSDRTIQTSSIDNYLVFEIPTEYYYGFMNEISPGYPFFTEFNETETGILIHSSDSIDKISRSFMAAIYVDIYYHYAQAGGLKKYDYISFSPINNNFVYKHNDDVTLTSDYIFLFSNYNSFNNYRLLQINGQKPFFSGDGKYLFSICDNNIESWFIDIETIAGIATDYLRNWYKYWE